MTTSSCHAPARRHAGWYYLRVRKFRRTAITTLPLGDGSSCNEMQPKTMPSYRSPELLWGSIRYATTELFNFRNPDPRCYVIPSYTGGSTDAFVANRLRRPMCFGAYGEMWAKPFGTLDTVDGPAPDVVVLVDSAGWHAYSLSEGAA